MDWALLVEAIKALAWPLAAVYIAYKFGDKLKKLKFGDKEIEFREIPQLAAGDKKPAEETNASTAQQKALPTPAIEQAPAAESALVDYAPTGAFVNAWARMEDTMRREVERLNLTGGTTILAARSLVSRLLRANVIDDGDAVAIIRLSDLRNRAVHEGQSPTVDAATQYIETIDELLRRVESGADLVRLRQLLEELRADAVQKVRVGPLRGGGVGATIEAARSQSESRQGKWAAACSGVIMMISSRDAALLLAAGARQVRDPESED